MLALTAGPALALGVFAGPASAGQNPTYNLGIVNGGFETGGSGLFAGSLSGWFAQPGDASVAFGTAHSGFAAAQVGSPTDSLAILSQGFQVPSGDNTLSFWYDVKCPERGGAEVWLSDDTTGTSTKPVQETCVADSGWTRVSVPVIPGDNYQIGLGTLQYNESYPGIIAAHPAYTLYDDITLSRVKSVRI